MSGRGQVVDSQDPPLSRSISFSLPETHTSLSELAVIAQEISAVDLKFPRMVMEDGFITL